MSNRDRRMDVTGDEPLQVISVGTVGPQGPATVAAGAVISERNKTIIGDSGDDPKAVATTYVYAEAYGDLSTSTGDAAANVTTITTALADVDGTGATLVFPPQSIPINAYLEWPDYIGLVGGGISATRFLATHASAGLYFANASLAHLGDFAFNGNDLATQGIRMDSSNAVHGKNIWVHNVLGDPFRLHNVQNSQFDNVQTNYNTYGLYLDDGSGSCVFNALKSSDNTYFQLKIGSSGVVASGYTEPTANLFLAPMLEWIAVAATTDAIATVVVEGSSGTMMLNAKVVAPSGGTLARPAMKFSQTGTAAESSMTFSNLSIIGSATYSTGIQSEDFGVLTFVGKNAITGATVGMRLDGATTTISGAPPTMNSVATPFAFSGGAGYANLVQFVSDEQFFTPRSAGRTVQRVQEYGEAGVRFFQNSDGSMEWGSGAGFSGDVALLRVFADTLGLGASDQFYAPKGITTMTKAGTPTDADIPFDVDGTMIVDTTASKLWIRISGTWKSVTLT